MRKVLLTSITILIGIISEAQVTLNLQLPLSGLRMKSQLWSIALANASAESQNVQLEMTLVDATNKQRILSGVTRYFSVAPGVKQLRPEDVMPVSYQVVGAGYNIDSSPEGFLPVGVFTVCYTLTKMSGDAVQVVAEACESIEVAPLSPLQLILPADSEYVASDRPLFSWTPLLPAALFTNLTYDWIVVEVNPAQSAKEAVELNTPLVKQQGITQTSWQYPQASPQLDTSRLYAWGVVAKNNVTPVLSSEARTFRVKPNLPKSTASANYYVRLSRQEDASFVICNDVLQFEYQNELNDSLVHLRVYDITTSLHEAIRLPKEEVAVRFGQNLLQLRLGDSRRFKDNHIYLLQLTSSRNEKWFLKFEYRKND